MYAIYNANDKSVVVDGVHITSLGEDMISVEKDETIAESALVKNEEFKMIPKECKVRVDGIDIYESDSGNDIYEPVSDIGNQNFFVIDKFLIDYDSPQKDMLIEKFEKKEPFELKLNNKKGDTYINQYCIIKDVVNCKEGMWFILAPHT